MSEVPKQNTEHFLPLGYTIDEIKAMDTDTLQQVCDEQNLDIDRVQELLDKSEHYPTASETPEDTPDTERPDLDLLKTMNRHLRDGLRGEFDIKTIRKTMLEVRRPNIPNPETHANGLVRHMEREKVAGKTDEELKPFGSGIHGFYFDAFREFGVKRYDELIAKKLTVYEAAQQLIKDLQTEYESKPHNQYLETGFKRALETFQDAMDFDEDRHALQTLFKKAIGSVATPEETQELNKVLRAAKGAYYRGGESTVSAGKYDRFIAGLSKVYEENLPAKHMNPGSVAATEVFDVNSHTEPPEIKEKLDQEGHPS